MKPNLTCRLHALWVCADEKERVPIVHERALQLPFVFCRTYGSRSATKKSHGRSFIVSNTSVAQLIFLSCRSNYSLFIYNSLGSKLSWNNIAINRWISDIKNKNKTFLRYYFEITSSLFVLVVIYIKQIRCFLERVFSVQHKLTILHRL